MRDKSWVGVVVVGSIPRVSWVFNGEGRPSIILRIFFSLVICGFIWASDSSFCMMYTWGSDFRSKVIWAHLILAWDRRVSPPKVSFNSFLMLSNLSWSVSCGYSGDRNSISRLANQLLTGPRSTLSMLFQAQFGERLLARKSDSNLNSHCSAGVEPSKVRKL